MLSKLKFQTKDIPALYCSEKQSSKFIALLKSIWDELHDRPDIFRYKVGNLQNKYVGDSYLLQLNPDRGSKRRPADSIDDICQPVNQDSFNFTKASSSEKMFEIIQEDDSEPHTVFVNVSPIMRYHSLLCPSLKRCLPQIATKESIQLILYIAFLAQDRDLRIGYNSLCAFASVNHLHYHLFLLENDLPIESVKCKKIKGNLYVYQNDDPVPGFAFQLKSKSNINQISQDIYDLISLLIKKNIPHNLFVSRGEAMDGGAEEVLRIVVWPRKSSKGFGKVDTFYVALCELSGWLPVYTAEDFNQLTLQNINDELSKWKYDQFTQLCDELAKSCYFEKSCVS